MLTLLIQKESVYVHNLNPISPLGNTKPLSEEFGSYTLSEITSYSLASFTLRKGTEGDARLSLIHI